jgi:hypothetical protein
MRCATLALLLVLSSPALADSILLIDETEIDGTIVQVTDQRVLVALDYGAVTIDPTKIKKVDLAGPATIEPTHMKEIRRLPSWRTALVCLAKQRWASNIHQIPATVIDVGVFKHIPYMSYRCGENDAVEMNIYGDPDEPSGVELGLYEPLLSNMELRHECVTFVSALLSKKADYDTVKAATLIQFRKQSNGLTTEVTPPTAEDAYGGWWISVYDEKQLNASRASDPEVKAISTAQREEQKQNDKKVASAEPRQPVTRKESAPAEPAATVPSVRTDWSSSDYSAVKRTSSDGRVYVRSYYRKDGTYVHAHTRSAPRR